jgi:putative ABC transport system substrate-binding protein
VIARFVVVVALACALVNTSARAQSILLVKSKGPQIDEAVLALKGELASGATASASVDVVEESAGADEVAQRAAALGKNGLVIGVGAGAAKLALKQSAVPVVHCMVLQDAAALDGPKSAGVPLALPAKAQLAALKRVAPSVKRVGLLYDPKLNARFAEDAKSAASALGLSLVAQPVSSATAALPALDDVVDKIDALLLAPDATVVTKELITFLVPRAFEKKLPVLAFSESIVRLGALAALAPSYAQDGKLCGVLAKRILAGGKPADLHGAVQMTGTLVVNVSTARRIGLSLAPDVLQPPTQVVGQ